MVFVLVVVLVNVVVVRALWRRRSRLASARGFGTAADLGRLREDVPRVLVVGLTVVAPGQTELRLGAAPDALVTSASAPVVAADYTIAMDERDPGFEILRDWRDARSVLGVVIPPDSPLIRLRNVDDLQPLTLRRFEA